MGHCSNGTVEADDGMQVYASAYVVLVICAPTSNQLIEFKQANYPRLQCLTLADNSHGDEELNIDILIGYFYRHFVSGSVIRGLGSGPIVLLTRLSYVLSGPVGIPVPEQGDCITSVIEEEDSLVRVVKHF